MTLEHKINRLRRSIEEQQHSGRVDIDDILRQLLRLEYDARQIEDDSDNFERKYKRLKRASK